jgi:DNA-binding response OmpR family regulator
MRKRTRTLGGRTAAASVARVPSFQLKTPPMQPRGHIVVVDDQEDIRECIGSALLSEGYQVNAFGSAEEALEFLGRNWDVGLVLIDLVLPSGMSGRELGEALQRHRLLSKLPIVAMSGRSLDRHALKGLTVAAFLEKPFELSTLLATAERFCRPAEKGVAA